MCSGGTFRCVLHMLMVSVPLQCVLLEGHLHLWKQRKLVKLSWKGNNVPHGVTCTFITIVSKGRAPPKCKLHGWMWTTNSLHIAWQSCGNISVKAHVPTAFCILPNSHLCFHNSVETWYMFSIYWLYSALYWTLNFAQLKFQRTRRMFEELKLDDYTRTHVQVTIYNTMIWYFAIFLTCFSKISVLLPIVKLYLKIKMSGVRLIIYWLHADYAHWFHWLVTSGSMTLSHWEFINSEGHAGFKSYQKTTFVKCFFGTCDKLNKLPHNWSRWFVVLIFLTVKTGQAFLSWVDW